MQSASDEVVAVIVGALFLGGLFSLFAGLREWRRKRARLLTSSRRGQ